MKIFERLMTGDFYTAAIDDGIVSGLVSLCAVAFAGSVSYKLYNNFIEISMNLQSALA